MSANYVQDQKYIDPSKRKLLQKQLELSWLKRETTTFNSASLALTTSGKQYRSGLMESRTHLLDMPSEHIVLGIAVAHKDPHVHSVITMVEGNKELNPIVLKFLADHVRRTGTALEYTVCDSTGKILHQLDSLSTYYQPEISVLEKIKDWQVRPQWKVLNPTASCSLQLFEAAKEGATTHFSSSTKTCYGAAVLANDIIHFAGVYSSFDRRTNIHSEMLAALSAIATGNREITEVAIVSTKFVDSVVQMCGCCRQFFSEIEAKTGQKITVHLFSYDGKLHQKFLLSELLPSKWDSGQSIEIKNR